MTNDRKTLKDSLLVFTGLRNMSWLLLPVVVGVGAYYSAHTVIQENIRDNREAVSDIREHLKRTDETIHNHSLLGHNGDPHPKGVIDALRDLERDVERRTADRFSHRDHSMWLIDVYLPKIADIERRLDAIEKRM